MRDESYFILARQITHTLEKNQKDRPSVETGRKSKMLLNNVKTKSDKDNFALSGLHLTSARNSARSQA